MPDGHAVRVVCSLRSRTRSPSALAALASVALLCAALLLAGCALRRAPSAQQRPGSAATGDATVAPQAASLAESAAPSASPRPAVAVTATAARPADAPRQRSAQLPSALDAHAILADTRRIAGIGVRRGGSHAEHLAGDYILSELRNAGYRPRVQNFPLPGGQSSRNITVVIPGSDPRRIVLSAHIDSRVPAPGANDDAVGCGVLLELAREARGRRPTPTIELDFFGSEEFRDSTPGAHHFGSRARVASLSAGELRRISGMITLDVIAVGSELHTRTMGRGPLGMSKLLLRSARRQGVRMTYLRDPGATGWSDHEAYEKAGVPVAWVERLDDPAYHIAADTAGRLTSRPIAQTVRVVLGALNSLDAAQLDRLR